MHPEFEPHLSLLSMNPDFTTYINVHPHKLIVYRRFTGQKRLFRRNKNSLLNLRDNSHRGRISSQAKSKIASYINIILAQAKKKRYWSELDQQYFTFRVNFITLTLPAEQKHTDQVIKRECLGQWLNELRRKFPNVKYFWRSEKQSNGNIHFHVLTDVFYHWKEVRSDWNRIVGKLGYIDAFESKYNHRNPNSTDIHAVKNIKNLGGYLAKYCMKENKESVIKGRNYGSSQNVIRFHKLSLQEGDFDLSELNLLTEREEISTFSNEYVTCFFGNIDKVLRSANIRLTGYYKSNLDQLRLSG